MEITRRLAEFAAGLRYEAIPPDAVELARIGLADCLCCMLAGVSTGPARTLLDCIRAEGGVGEASVVGTTMRVPASAAAWVNGTAAHSLDFDDINAAMLGHPSAAVLPAVLAIAEKFRVRGSDMLAAYVAGLETAARLGTLVNPRHYALGWHTTVSLGTIAAAVASAHLMRLDVGQIRTAIGVAASHAGGLRINFGTDTKPFHAGMAARSGVVSAQLALAGMTACQAALDGERGLLAMMSGRTPLDADTSGFFGPATGLEILRSGLTIKQHACCGTAHTAIDALLGILERDDIPADRVAGIECRINSLAPSILVYDLPSTVAEARFSMRYCLATALVDRACGLPQFTPARMQEPELRSAMQRITVAVDPELPTDVGGLTAAVVTIRLTSGESLTRRVDHPVGSPHWPLDAHALRRKFTTCASVVLDESRIDALLGLLPQLDDLPGIDPLIALLSPSAERQS